MVQYNHMNNYDLEELLMHSLASFLESAEGDEDFLHEYIQHTLLRNEEYRVKGIGLDYHGHRGMNGARGTSMSFSNNNLAMITAHEHSPKLHPNGMVVGTLTYLKLPYTKGASSWMHANGILYSSGKYSLLTIII